VSAARAIPGASGGLPSGELEYVGFWPRLVAQIVDSLWITPVVMVIGYKFVHASPDLADQLLRDPASVSVAALSAEFVPTPAEFVVQYLLPALLILAFWLYKGATPGKMLLHARIVDASSGGEPARRQLVIRYLGYYLCILTLFLGFIWVAVDPRKQGFHDKLAGTVVVRPRSVVSFPGRTPP